MPHDESEFELLTIPEIAAQRGVSRQHVHRTAQTDPDFPDPVVTSGSTRAKYRSDEIDHYFDNRVLRPGRRTDLERP